MNVPAPRSPVTAALDAMVDAALGAAIGYGDIDQAANADGSPIIPFVIRFSLDGQRSGPPWADKANTDAEWTYQFTSVGASEAHAQAVADMVALAVLGRNANGWLHDLVIAAVEEPVGTPLWPAQTCTWREMESTSGAIASGSVVTVADRYTLYTTPS